VPYLPRALRPLYDLWVLWALWKLMRERGFDLVPTHTSKAGLLGRVAARLTGVPRLIHTAHGHVYYGYHGPALSRVFVWLERWASGFTDRLIALTRAVLAEHLSFWGGPPPSSL